MGISKMLAKKFKLVHPVSRLAQWLRDLTVFVVQMNFMHFLQMKIGIGIAIYNMLQHCVHMRVCTNIDREMY